MKPTMMNYVKFFSSTTKKRKNTFLNILSKYLITNGIMIIIFISFFQNTIAQITFIKTYQFGIYESSSSYSLLQTSDDGYIITGSKFNSTNGTDELYLVKTDKFGDTLWTKSFGKPYHPKVGYDIINTNDGGTAILGIEGHTYDPTAYLLKLDSDYDTVWSKTYNNYIEGTLKCYSLVQTSDDGYLFAATHNNPGDQFSEIMLVKTNNLGDTIWTSLLDSTKNEIANTVQITPDNGYVVSGMTDTYGWSTSGFAALLAKFDSDGNIEWVKSFPTYGSVGQWPSVVKVTSDNGYIWCVNSDSFLSSILIKLNEQGDTTWTIDLNTDISTDRNVNDLIQTTNGDFVVTGSIKIKHEDNWTDEDVYIAKVNASGTFLWEKYINVIAHSNDVGMSIIETSDEGYAITGGNASSFHLIKLNSNGVVQVAENYLLESLNIYPNPVNDAFTVSVKTNSQWSFQLIDLMGKIVLNEKNINSKVFTINASSFNNGVYFFVIKTDESIRSGKILIQ